MAGHGRIAVDIRGEVTRPLVEIAERCEGIHTVTFVPQECCLHSIVITMNGVPVPGETDVSLLVHIEQSVRSVCLCVLTIRFQRPLMTFGIDIRHDGLP